MDVASRNRVPASEKVDIASRNKVTSTARTVIHLIVFIVKNFVHFDALLL